MRCGALRVEERHVGLLMEGNALWAVGCQDFLMQKCSVNEKNLSYSFFHTLLFLFLFLPISHLPSNKSNTPPPSTNMSRSSHSSPPLFLISFSFRLIPLLYSPRLSSFIFPLPLQIKKPKKLKNSKNPSTVISNL